LIRERLDERDTNTGVMRAHGVWAVISPWNFPHALLGAPVAAALLTGSTVVMKQAIDAPMASVMVMRLSPTLVLLASPLAGSAPDRVMAGPASRASVRRPKSG